VLVAFYGGAALIGQFTLMPGFVPLTALFVAVPLWAMFVLARRWANQPGPARVLSAPGSSSS
jgi:hypothetical protein